VFAPALLNEKESAGVVVAFDTDVVKSGERLPLLKEDTVPPPDNPSQLLTAPSVVTKAVSPCSAFIFAPPQIVGCAIAPNDARVKRITNSFFMLVKGYRQTKHPYRLKSGMCSLSRFFRK